MTTALESSGGTRIGRISQKGVDGKGDFGGQSVDRKLRGDHE
jgi:hypothetical protein